MSSRGSHSSGGYENGMAVEDAIITHLKELNLVGTRNNGADDRDEYELNQVYDEIVHNVINHDRDASR
ncbi:hypothetical protein PENTCL1PPCAC_22406, partial [Pristionchus entomophagus]